MQDMIRRNRQLDCHVEVDLPRSTRPEFANRGVRIASCAAPIVVRDVQDSAAIWATKVADNPIIHACNFEIFEVEIFEDD